MSGTPYLIGFDLDGTLLTTDKHISERTRKVLEEAAQAGNYCVPVTGRPLSGIPNELRGLTAIRYLVCSSGAVIYDTKNDAGCLRRPDSDAPDYAEAGTIQNPKAPEPIGRLIYHQVLPSDVGIRLYGMLKEEETLFELFCDGYGYQSSRVSRKMDRLLAGTSIYSYIKSSRKCVPDFRDFLQKRNSEIDMISIMCISVEVKKRVWDLLGEFEDISAFSPAEKDIEIVSSRAGKGNALSWLSEKLCIAKDRVVAIGDSDNDRSMLEHAGISIAMGNADASVKKLADFVTEDNDHDGAAYAIARLNEIENL